MVNGANEARWKQTNKMRAAHADGRKRRKVLMKETEQKTFIGDDGGGRLIRTSQTEKRKRIVLPDSAPTSY